MAALHPGVKMYVANGRFLASEGDWAVFAVPDKGLLTRAEGKKSDLEAALSQHFDRHVRLKLVIDEGARPAAAPSPSAPGPADYEPDPEDIGDWEEMAAAPEVAVTPEQRLMQAFPGAEEVPNS